MHAENETAVLARALQRECGGRWTLRRLNASGFCATWRADSADRRLFVKTLPASGSGMLHAEADGLRALAAAGVIRVPAVAGLCRLPEGGVALAMEWLDLRAPDAGFGARFGAALGALHTAPCALQPSGYGWRRDNWLGATPQTNRRSAGTELADWLEFLGHERLGGLRDRLAAHGGAAVLCAAADAVVAALPGLFDDGYRPRPSLIHGDLWSGNWGMLADGTPVIFDPAVSCSDAEAELAMMELFGSPPAAFWPAYRASARLHPGYARRRPVYQLYHLLNHALLFGGGYGQQALSCAQRALRPTG